jgi:hypothetical protein
MLKKIIFTGEIVSYIAGDPVEEAKIHGFATVAEDRSLRVANRIFEAWLHTNLEVDDFGFESASSKQDELCQEGRIDMELVLEKFSAQASD